MTFLDTGVLLLAGFAASTVNAVAGGGSLITFPTLVAIGLPPVAANVTNSLAVSPGYVASVHGSRGDLAVVAARQGRGEVLRLLPSAVAATAAVRAPLRTNPGPAGRIRVALLLPRAGAA